MLEGLERADRAGELVPLLQVASRSSPGSAPPPRAARRPASRPPRPARRRPRGRRPARRPAAGRARCPGSGRPAGGSGPARPPGLGPARARRSPPRTARTARRRPGRAAPTRAARQPPRRPPRSAGPGPVRRRAAAARHARSPPGWCRAGWRTGRSAPRSRCPRPARTAAPHRRPTARRPSRPPRCRDRGREPPPGRPPRPRPPPHGSWRLRRRGFPGSAGRRSRRRRRVPATGRCRTARWSRSGPARPTSRPVPGAGRGRRRGVLPPPRRRAGQAGPGPAARPCHRGLRCHGQPRTASKCRSLCLLKRSHRPARQNPPAARPGLTAWAR